MKFRGIVEPPERMKGLEVPEEIVDALGGGNRPRVNITINGHTWNGAVAHMRGRHLLGLSKANREAAKLVIGEEVEVEVEFDPAPPAMDEPPELVSALDADSAARAGYDRLPPGKKRKLVLDIDAAKTAETRTKRIEKALATLREQ